jgi:WD40 repeat protein
MRLSRLVKGLVGIVDDPQAVLDRILDWTNGQPFLTQKLCQLIVESQQNSRSAKQNAEPVNSADLVDQLVQFRIIHNWKTQDNPEHLRTIRDRIQRNDQRVARMLAIYQQILQSSRASAFKEQLFKSDRVKVDDSREQIELLLSGLVVQEQGYLQIRCPIYEKIFNLDWIEQQLAALRPYSEAFNAWVASNQEDQSRLLRGQSLRSALNWSTGKSLSDLDYRFLTASQELEQQDIRSRLEQRNLRQQNLILSLVSVALLISIGLGAVMFTQYRQALEREQQLRISEVQAIASSSEALFASGRRLDALVQAIKAQARLQTLERNKQASNAEALHQQVELTLQQVVYGAIESNRLSGFKLGINSAVFSPNGAYIATANLDSSVQLWKPDGTPLVTMQGHSDRALSVAFSPDSSTLMSTGADGKINFWSLNGKLLKTLKAHQNAVWRAIFSPDGSLIASASLDRTVKLWKRDGTLLKTLPHEGLVLGLDFSPDGRSLVTGAFDSQVRIWRVGNPSSPEFGTLLRTLSGHGAEVTSVVYRPTGSLPTSALIVSAGLDGKINLWRPDGSLVKTLENDSEIENLAFSPDGQTFVSVSANGLVKLWRYDGTDLATFRGHDGEIRGVAFSPDGQTILSASLDRTIRFWKPGGMPFLTILRHEIEVSGLAVSPDGERIVSATSSDKLDLWDQKGALLRSLNAHIGKIQDVAFNSNGRTFATADGDGAVKLWDRDGALRNVLIKPSAASISQQTVAFSPNGAYLAAGDSNGGKLILWDKNFTRVRTIPACTAVVGTVEFAPNSQTIATGCSESTIKLWNTSGKLLREFKGHQALVWDVAFSPDGTQLVSGSIDVTAKLWRSDGKLLTTFTQHKGPITSVAYTSHARYANNANGTGADGILIASASNDCSIKLWRSDGTLVATLNEHTGSVNKVEFSADERKLISASTDGTVIIWDLNTVIHSENVLEFGCKWVEGYLKNNSDLPESDRTICDAASNTP